MKVLRLGQDSHKIILTSEGKLKELYLYNFIIKLFIIIFLKTIYLVMQANTSASIIIR